MWNLARSPISMKEEIQMSNMKSNARMCMGLHGNAMESHPGMTRSSNTQAEQKWLLRMKKLPRTKGVVIATPEKH